MIEIASVSDEASLVLELRDHVSRIAPSLDTFDAELAKSLISLISHLKRISALYPDPLSDVEGGITPVEPRLPADIYSTLSRQVSDLKIQRVEAAKSSGYQPPAVAVESALLWNQIDHDLEIILRLCLQRTERDISSSQPPGYEDQADMELPVYEDGDNFRDVATQKQRLSAASPRVGNSDEKMRLDLDAVALAIDRFYRVAPQLHNQRVELREGKLEAMERARRESLASMKSDKALGKMKAEDDDVQSRDLEKMLELIGKASSRRLDNQAVVLDDRFRDRVAQAHQNEIVKKQQFVEQLINHSGIRRIDSQDALPTVSTTLRNPETMLTLPEFIREPLPVGVNVQDPEAMLTLPEFVSEPVPANLVTPPPPPLGLKRSKSRILGRNRSSSAPPLAWLLPGSNSSSRSASPHPKTRVSDSGPKRAGLDVQYVAEHQENLGIVFVFLRVEGAHSTGIVAEVLPDASDSAYRERLILRSGSSTSPPLLLPTGVDSGRHSLRAFSAHYELKLIADSSATPAANSDSSPLLDATQLQAMSPTSFVCVSCSLPLAIASKVSRYADLPSEYWTELVEAWVCHTDQKLTEAVGQYAQKGFWPKDGQVLVGGSYLLMEEAAVVKTNIRTANFSSVSILATSFTLTIISQNGESYLTRCICGAVVGRYHPSNAINSTPSAYRFTKYGIRPMGPTLEPSRIPLSAFIVEDMLAVIHAHARYRFIIHDEEEEKPRLLIWALKPSIRLSYSISHFYTIPRSASILAAKVLYKIVGPTTTAAEFDRLVASLPGFSFAEHLHYPFDVCHRLATLMRESNKAYPENLRTMTGLDVGWLQRSA
ncbi:hypothetical protein SISNIDRAFT_407377 [Sistotremastrum niveocremeum HHB9708]|uniref:Uncharacterized protein n=1 Tax=Sistotremastrum niveocremeum HHB9708 TaxID=1314777 RepID=A0A164XRY9_9AGAM|nr:hypothetical protein SISNIDRAFT_407377 [Sistotremastrum niveocremeum HHB9708]